MLNKKPEQIQKMFNDIADSYDFCNNIISLFTHNPVKKYAIKKLDIKQNAKILDFCCGTGDMGKYIKKLFPLTEITGIDFSEKMLNIAKNKNPNIQYVLKDVTNTDFKDNTFDYVTEAFGLRNIENREKALDEIYRILKPEGYFLHLDFNGQNFLNNIFYFYATHSVRIFAKKNLQAYKYLTESIKNFPNSKDFIKEVEMHNFSTELNESIFFGVISFQIYKKIKN